MAKARRGYAAVAVQQPVEDPVNSQPIGDSPVEDSPVGIHLRARIAVFMQCGDIVRLSDNEHRDLEAVPKH